MICACSLPLLSDDPNPEVILSVLDLCRISSFASFECTVRSENRAEFMSHSLADAQAPDARFTSRDHRWLYEADTARFRLIDCLMTYFNWLHYSDRVKRECRAYLGEELEKLSCGDFVITFNWDTLVERCLWEASRWSPADGYGFTRDLRRADNFGHPPVCGKLVEPSEVLFLKLHGSVGWFRWGSEVYLTDDLLNNLLVAEEFMVCVFLSRKRGPRPDVHAVLAYPSFLKKLDVPVILDIWQKADAARRQADEIEIWGYSLPESDSAARVLFNSVRGRHQGNAVRIHVAGDNEARNRWRTFLPSATVDDAKLGV